MFQVDAFSDRPFAGNPAAVLVLPAPLPVSLMQAIAAENNLAETAFVTPAAKGWHIRWFTPLHEAAFCGHATLAAAHVLAAELGQTGPFHFTTERVGPIDVATTGAGLYELDLPRHDPQRFVPAGDWLRLCGPGFVAAFRNFENVFVELAGAGDVAAFRPDLPALAAQGGDGLCVTAAGGASHDGTPADFCSRYFAPAAGIDEDPVTGSTHATLVPYWAARLGRHVLTSFQASRRGGLLACSLTDKRVRVAGHAATFLSGDIRLPD